MLTSYAQGYDVISTITAGVERLYKRTNHIISDSWRDHGYNWGFTWGYIG